jgi:anti-sigma B factor antagonist
MDFRVEMDARADILVIAFSGEFDMVAAATLPDWSASINGQRKVEADLSGLTFIDSSGLRELLRLKQEVEGKGRSLVLRCPSASQVSRVLDLTGFNRIFNVLE